MRTALEAAVIRGAAALTRIRDGHFYRETYRSYDEYLESIPMSRRKADQIVTAYKIRQRLYAFTRKATA